MYEHFIDLDYSPEELELGSIRTSLLRDNGIISIRFKLIKASMNPTDNSSSHHLIEEAVFIEQSKPEPILDDVSVMDAELSTDLAGLDLNKHELDQIRYLLNTLPEEVDATDLEPPKLL